MSVTDITVPSNHQEAKTPPVVKGWPLVGVVPQVMRYQLDFIHESFLKYGDIFTLDLGVTDIVCLNHPDYAEHVLVSHIRNYAKGGAFWDGVRKVLGNGLSVSEGEVWRRQRRLIQPHFHRQRLQGLTETMAQTINKSLATWVKHPVDTPFDIQQAMVHMTMQVIVKAMFGTGLSEAESDQVGKQVGYAIDYVIRGVVTSSLPQWLPVPGRKEYLQAIQELDTILFRVIDRRRQEGVLTDDFLSMLLHMVDDETGAHMSNQELRDEAITMFIAGFETTSVALSWVFYFIAQHPDIQQRAQAEVDQVLGQRPPQFEDLPQLPYLRAIFEEALRLYSVAYWIPRTAVADDVIGGYQIKAGQIVGVVAHNIHRHPAFWENPTQFNPDRFMEDAAKKRHALAWIPFSTGQRQCIGRDFSLLESKLILASVLQKYQLQSVPGRIPQPHLGATLRIKGGVWVYLHPRERK